MKKFNEHRKEEIDCKCESIYEEHELQETEYQGKKVTLNNPVRGGSKKFYVYVKNDKGNTVMVKFGDPNMEIKRDDPDRRKNFRSRHQCDSNPGPKWKARYWSCRMWEKGKSVSELTGSEDPIEAFYIKQAEREARLAGAILDEDDFLSQEEILALNPLLDEVYFIEEEAGV